MRQLLIYIHECIDVTLEVYFATYIFATYICINPGWQEVGRVWRGGCRAKSQSQPVFLIYADSHFN